MREMRDEIHIAFTWLPGYLSGNRFGQHSSCILGHLPCSCESFHPLDPYRHCSEAILCLPLPSQSERRAKAAGVNDSVAKLSADGSALRVVCERLEGRVAPDPG